MHVAKNITVFTTALGPWYNIKKCVWAGGLISFEQITYTSLHVEMHEFICNHDAYDVVIEKVVVGYHSLMRFLIYTVDQKNCGVCVEGPCNVHSTLSSYILTSMFL